MILTPGTDIIPPGIRLLNWVKGNRYYLIYTDEVSVYFPEWEGKRWIRVSLGSRVILRWSRLSGLWKWPGLVS